MTAKEYLQQVKSKDAEIDNLHVDKEGLIAMLYSLGGGNEGERVQSSRNNDKFGTLYSRIDEREREITEKIDALVDFKLNASDKINVLSDDRYKKLLHKRYIQYKSWEMIAVELGYTYAYVIELHGYALQEFSKTYKNLLNSY